MFAFCISADADQRNAQTKQAATQQRQPTVNPTTTPTVQREPSAVPGQQTTGEDTGQPQDLGRVFRERLVDPVTWFTGVLLLVAIWQLSLTERSLRLLNRPWLDTDGWRAAYREPFLAIDFSILNPSKTPARIRSMQSEVAVTEIPGVAVSRLETMDNTVRDTQDVKILLTPGRTHLASIHFARIDLRDPFSAAVRDAFEQEGLILVIKGRITYADIFGATHVRKFGQICQWGGRGRDARFGPLTAAGENDEEGWP